MKELKPSSCGYKMPSKRTKEGRCMKGGIYTRQKCVHCEKNLLHDPRRGGCFCPDHPDQRATRFIVKFPGGIYKRFKDYEDAVQELNYLRHEKTSRKKKFNPNDYRSSKPNSFVSLKDKYFSKKKKRISFNKIKYYMDMAADHFGMTNIRDISGADISEYLESIPNISEKTRHNHKTQLINFWNWCLGCGNIITLAEMPTFPDIDYDLGLRKITDWDTQEKMIKKIKEMSYDINPKIWFGIDMLATYTALRPDDLRRVTESSLDSNGILVIYNPTKRKNKFKKVRLVEDHVEEWRSLQQKYPGLPDKPFFRHTKTNGRAKADVVFGINYLYKWWEKAAKEIGLEGVSLYPGTKHTTATETAACLGTEKARAASGLTNKAFDRYCQIENIDALEVATAIRAKKKASIIPINRSRTSK